MCRNSPSSSSPPSSSQDTLPITKVVLEMLKVITSVVKNNQSLLLNLTNRSGSSVDSSAELSELQRRLDEEEEKSKSLAEMLEKCIADNDAVCSYSM